MKCPNCEEGENIMKKGPGLFECEECGEDWGDMKFSKRVI